MTIKKIQPFLLACFICTSINLQAQPPLAIDANGNVGIGTNSPTEKLHVNNGNIKITRDYSNGIGPYVQFETPTKTGSQSNWVLYSMQSGGHMLGAYNFGVILPMQAQIVAYGE
jgi:hypothetical protein